MHEKIILDEKAAKLLIEKSKHPLKLAFSSILLSAINYVKNTDDVEDELIITCTNFLVQAGKSYEREIAESVSSLLKFLSDSGSNLSKPSVVEHLEGPFIPPFYIALWLAIQCIETLTSSSNKMLESEQQRLYKYSKMLGELTFIDVLTTPVLEGETMYLRRLEGAREGAKNKKEKGRALKSLVISLAKRIWSKYPDLSANAVAGFIHYRLQELLSSYAEQGCKWYLSAGLYDEVTIETALVDGIATELPEKDYRYNGEISDTDPTKMLVPKKLPKMDAIRMQISSLSSSKGRKPTREQIKGVEDLLDLTLACTEANCACQK